ncbi:MAG: xanthine dehydrogenase accessory factor [Acidimicrobiaceae bacterium]|nr:xanthine dehydrogenase accessory factor [Acidimicrobiaceae bacterium]
MSTVGTVYERFRDALAAERPVVLATVVRGPHIGAKLLVDPDREPVGTLGHPELDRVVARDALAELEAASTGLRHYGAGGQNNPEDIDGVEYVDIFIESFARAPQMLIFGAVDFTAALAKVAKILGYRVTVCDAREVFATKRRFPMADEIVVDWPNRIFDRVGAQLLPRDAVCILTHDPKFDVPAIQGALASRAGYIGVMGSRRTHAKRAERLAEVGITDATQLARIMAPIGLDIGARSPEETAVSICAEIIALRTGRDAPSLRDADGPIHA